jgi:hypothetical protein
MGGLFRAFFRHDGEKVAVGVAEEGHPKFVVGHFGDEMRFAFEGYAALLEGLVG